MLLHTGEQSFPLSMRNPMKRLLWTAAATMVLLTPAVADHHKEKSWLDLEKCDICKCMGEHMDVMQQVTWETHKIDNGMLSASVIPKKHRTLMDKLHVKMESAGEELASGKSMELCGFCNSYDKLKKAGAKEQQVKTEFGMIGMLTSDDPEVVKQIHSHADRTIKEFEAMKKLMGK